MNFSPIWDEAARHFARLRPVAARLAAPAVARFKQQPVAGSVALAVLVIAVVAIVDAAVGGPRAKRFESMSSLQGYYLDLGYVERAVSSGETGVPRLYLSSIPEGWTDGEPVAIKKSVFFRSVLPLVLTVNEEIARDRARLKQIAAAYRANRSVGADDRAWLRRLAVRYEVAETDDGNAPVGPLIDRLLRRVDTIPPSLALAQAAIESGYGSSRFAVEGNALFGQWRTGGGLRPREQRAHLSRFGIAAFKSPLHSVRAYAHNLNTFPAYRGFRALRAKQAPRDTLALASTLTAYSELGEEYVAKVRRVVTQNGLTRFDNARLRDGRAVSVRPIAHSTSRSST